MKKQHLAKSRRKGAKQLRRLRVESIIFGVLLTLYILSHFTQIIAVLNPVKATGEASHDVVYIEKVVEVIKEVPTFEPSTEGLITFYADKYKTNREELKCVLKNESGLRKAATNGTSSASGMGQFIKSTWISWRTEMHEDPDLNLRFDADEMIKTTAFGLSKGRQTHWEAWKTHCTQFAK